MDGTLCAGPCAVFVNRQCSLLTGWRRLTLWTLLLGILPAGATAATISPVSYSMPNGQKSNHAEYFDETYTGSGDVTTSLSPLMGGTGDLTDGVIASDSWNVASAPFVGWVTVDPTILFHFAGAPSIHQIDLYFDDTEGLGGVNAPARLELNDGQRAVSAPVTPDAERGLLHVSLTELQFEGEFIELTITRNDGWVMLSEVQFEGTAVPEPVGGISGLLIGLLGLVRLRRKPVV